MSTSYGEYLDGLIQQFMFIFENHECSFIFCNNLTREGLCSELALAADQYFLSKGGSFNG